MLEVSPKPGRDPLGDARFDPALRVQPGRRRRAARPSSRPAGWFACHGRPRRTCAPGPRSTAPVPLRRGAARRAHARRRPRKTGIRRNGAARPDARAGFRPAPRSRRARPVQVELATDETHDGRRHELAGSQQAAGVAAHVQLQREAQLVAGASPGRDVLQVLVAQGVVPQQVRLALRQGEQGRPLPARQDGSP